MFVLLNEIRCRPTAAGDPSRGGWEAGGPRLEKRLGIMNEHRPCKRILPVLGFIGIIGLWYAASSAPGWNHFLFP